MWLHSVYAMYSVFGEYGFYAIADSFVELSPNPEL